MWVAVAGAATYAFGASEFFINRPSGAIAINSDTFLARDGAANTLALRNSTNAQTFRVYNTYTDASNYERGYAGWSSNIFFVGAEAGGTGTKQPLRLSGGGVEISPLAGTTTAAWYFNSAGHFLANADNTYDIGAEVADRPRTLYVASNGFFGQNVQALLSVAAYASTPPPAGGTTGKGFLLSSTTNFGVFFGSGAPTLSAAKGSLYLRSDGSGTGDRMYVNTDGSTAWTAVTTAT